MAKSTEKILFYKLKSSKSMVEISEFNMQFSS
jgi:hypothetical protein